MSRPPFHYRKRRTSFTDYLKNFFFILLILQFAPSVISNLRTTVQELVVPKAKVGYMRIGGVIMDSAPYNKRLKEFADRDDIKALLIRMESPGGTPASSQSVYQELKKFAKKKPVIVLVENLCASGAYYIASAANKIIANPSSLVGSIGVLLRIPTLNKLIERWDVKMNYITSGKYKVMARPFKELADFEREHLQALSDDTYNQFVSDVAESSGLDKAQATTWADGKIFSGNQALKLKMIDSIGTFSDAEDELKKILKLKDDEEIKFISLKKRPSGLMRLLMGDEDYASNDVCSSHVATFIGSVYSKVINQVSGSEHIKQS